VYYTKTVTLIEQPVFTKQVTELVDDDDYREFQNELARNPEKGPVVQGSGGLRKVRMALPGRGKSAGARVLYLYFARRQTIILYYVYTKGDIEDIPTAQMKGIKHEVQRIKKAFGEGDLIRRGRTPSEFEGSRRPSGGTQKAHHEGHQARVACPCQTHQTSRDRFDPLALECQPAYFRAAVECVRCYRTQLGTGQAAAVRPRVAPA
jgi:hypothetical protein